jgi:hypothetical protein
VSFKSESEVLCFPASTHADGGAVAPAKIDKKRSIGQNRFIALRYDCGDNLSVRFHIQNSISLTIAIPPRIIPARFHSTERELEARRD